MITSTSLLHKAALLSLMILSWAFPLVFTSPASGGENTNCRKDRYYVSYVSYESHVLTVAAVRERLSSSLMFVKCFPMGLKHVDAQNQRCRLPFY